MTVQAAAHRLARELEFLRTSAQIPMDPAVGLADAAEALLVKLAEHDPDIAEIVDRTLYERKTLA